MSDPAIEAAQRAREARFCDRPSPFVDVSAAHEALSPIRDLARKLRESYEGKCGVMWPGVKTVLTELEPLIYSTEELES